MGWRSIVCTSPSMDFVLRAAGISSKTQMVLMAEAALENFGIPNAVLSGTRSGNGWHVRRELL